MTKVLQKHDNGAELVLTNDSVNPFGLRVDGTVVIQSWSRVLMERLLGDGAFLEEVGRELDKL